MRTKQEDSKGLVNVSLLREGHRGQTTSFSEAARCTSLRSLPFSARGKLFRQPHHPFPALVVQTFFEESPGGAVAVSNVVCDCLGKAGVARGERAIIIIACMPGAFLKEGTLRILFLFLNGEGHHGSEAASSGSPGSWGCGCSPRSLWSRISPLRSLVLEYRFERAEQNRARAGSISFGDLRRLREGEMGTAGERRWLLAFLVGLLFVGFACGDAGVVGDVESVGSGDKFAPLIKEIERLKARVGTLDSSVRDKDAHIAVIEKELEVLREQKDDGVGEKETLSKFEKELDSTAIKVKELEEQLLAATKDAEQAQKYAQALKKRAESAEERVRELTSKYEQSQASLSASKKHVADVEKALKNAEADIAEAQTRLKTHGEELSRVHNQWLPPWAASQLAIFQTRAHSKWSSHAKPGVDAFYKHASQKAAEVHAVFRPHFDRVAGTVGPEARKLWKAAGDSIAPHVELVRTKTTKGYEFVKKEYVGQAQEFVKPHFKNVMETTRPYVNIVQEHTRPYVDQISTASKTFLDKARNVVNPYVEKASPYYRDAVSAALKHHENLQEAVRKNLSKSELAASVVTQELVWFIASALLALPVLIGFLLFSSAFGGKKTVSRPRKRVSQPGSSTSSGTPGSKSKRSKKADK